MSVTVLEKNLLKTLENQQSIDWLKASPVLGVNIKLIDSVTGNSFVGMVSKLNAAILNADSGIYNSMAVDGIDQNGAKKTLILTIEDLENDAYGPYDELYYTVNLEDQAGAIIFKESVDGDLVDESVSIQVFDAENVSVGKLIVFKKADDTEIKGIITSLKPDILGVTSVGANGRPVNAALSLADATDANFIGAVLEASFGSEPEVGAGSVGSVEYNGSAIPDLDTLEPDKFISDAAMTFKVGLNGVTNHFELAVPDITKEIVLEFDSAPLHVELTEGANSFTPAVSGNRVIIPDDLLPFTMNAYILTVDAVTVEIYAVATVKFVITGIDALQGDKISADFTYASPAPSIDDGFDETDIDGDTTLFFVRGDSDTLELAFEAGTDRLVSAVKNGVNITSPDSTLFAVGIATVIELVYEDDV